MTDNFYTLRLMAALLDENVRGLQITDVFTQEKGKLVIIFETSNAIEFSASKEQPYIVMRDGFARAGKNAVDLFADARGSRVVSAELINNDRFILIRFEGGSGLLFSFFGGPNCYAVSEGMITDAFKNSIAFKGRSADELFRREETGSSDGTAAGLLKASYPHFGKLYRNEALTRAGLAGASSPAREEIGLLRKVCDGIVEEISEGNYLLYSSDNGPVMSLVRLSGQWAEEPRRFENINSLVLTYNAAVFRHRKEQQFIKSRLAELNSAMKSVLKKQSSLEAQVAMCSEGLVLQRKGELILANIHNIMKGQDTFIPEGEGPEIRLSPELTAPQNAARYFEKAKKQKASVPLLEKRLRQVNSEIASISREIEKLEHPPYIKTVIRESKKQKKMQTDETNRFRKFSVEGDYEVWVGKDSASNDLLTTRFTSQNDLWFHVRGTSGSHTVLKVKNNKENIPKEAILSAASVAAYYSKARNAGNVPVAYCEKKYVKKKKGLAQGAVMMEREKVVFVRPGLPSGEN